MASEKHKKTSDFSEDQRIEIGDRIRMARQDKGLLQSEMAEKMEYSINHYNRVENGRVPYGMRFVTKAAEVLQVRKQWLLTGEDGMRTAESVGEDPGRYAGVPTDSVSAVVRIMRNPQAEKTVRSMVEDLHIDEQHAWEAVVRAALKSTKTGG